jgi:hypothetical protein
MKTNYVAVLITGSREWKDWRAIERVLRDVQERHMHRDQITQFVLVQGECEGADAIAASLARTALSNWGWSVLPMPAQWKSIGERAGSARNSAMLMVVKKLFECGYICEVHAFPLPLSVGTLHMMSIAKAAGFEVIDHSKLSLPHVGGLL